MKPFILLATALALFTGGARSEENTATPPDNLIAKPTTVSTVIPVATPTAATGTATENASANATGTATAQETVPALEPVPSPLTTAPLTSRKVEGQAIKLPSASPSGFKQNDTIYFTYYAPLDATPEHRVPAAILLHFLGANDNHIMEDGGCYAAEHGVATAVMTLPYHGLRKVPHQPYTEHFVSGTADQVVQGLGQSVSDVHTVTDWLVARPEIDVQKLGVVGVSLGAIVAHVAMGQDKRLWAGVAMLGGGDIPLITRSSIAGKAGILINKWHKDDLTPDDERKLRAVDPITYADRNRPRRVLMVQAARDFLIPPATGVELWNALGRPPIRWLDINHAALRLTPKSSMRPSVAFLKAVWDGKSDEEALAETPKIKALTLKSGFIMGLDYYVTPAIQYQALSLGKWRHMSILSANVGWSGRGPFVGFAGTVNQFVDAGLGHRLINGKGFSPYVSFHIVF